MLDAVPLTDPDERIRLLGLLSSAVASRDEAIAIVQLVFARGDYCDGSGACTICRMQPLISSSHQLAVETALLLGLDPSAVETGA